MNTIGVSVVLRTHIYIGVVYIQNIALTGRRDGQNSDIIILLYHCYYITIRKSVLERLCERL